jgi:hypothetical protein
MASSPRVRLTNVDALWLAWNWELVIPWIAGIGAWLVARQRQIRHPIRWGVVFFLVGCLIALVIDGAFFGVFYPIGWPVLVILASVCGMTLWILRRPPGERPPPDRMVLLYGAAVGVPILGWLVVGVVVVYLFATGQY